MTVAARPLRRRGWGWLVVLVLTYGLLAVIIAPDLLLGDRLRVIGDVALALPRNAEHMGDRDMVFLDHPDGAERHRLRLDIPYPRADTPMRPREAWVGPGVRCDSRSVPDCRDQVREGPVVQCRPDRLARGHAMPCRLTVPLTGQVLVSIAEASTATADRWGTLAEDVVSFVEARRVQGNLAAFANARHSVIRFGADFGMALLVGIALLGAAVVFCPPIGLALAGLVPAVRLASKMRRNEPPTTANPWERKASPGRNTSPDDTSRTGQ
jgi:hypothetical protein